MTNPPVSQRAREIAEEELIQAGFGLSAMLLGKGKHTERDRAFLRAIDRALNDRPLPSREDVTLAECPPGPFLFEGRLGFKSEYMTRSGGEFGEGRYHHDAYVGESGEYFWGGASSIEERQALLVTPISADAILSLLGGGE